MRKLHRVIILGGWLLFASRTCSAAPGDIEPGLSRVWDRTWVDEPWTGDDKPYLQLRQSIDKLYTAKKLNDTDLKRYKQASLNKPEDALARFKWAFYALCFALLQPDPSDGSVKLDEVPKQLRFRPSPHTYQYTRMRFLVMTYLSMEDAQVLSPLGERLLKRDPKDILVKYYQIENLFTGRPEDEKRVLRYAQELVRDYPTNPAVHAILGFAYKRRWWVGHKKEDADKAIASYRKYLALAKPVGIQRKRMENSIKQMMGKQ